MTSLRSSRLVAWTFVAVLGLAGVLQAESAWAQEKKPSAAAEEKPAAKKATGRLPAYYTGVVTPQQREAIYKIQAEYTTQLDELKAKVASLTKERDERVAALLTPEQKEKIEKAKEAATAKRAAKAAEGKDKAAEAK
jgi:hypothetical protein